MMRTAIEELADDAFERSEFIESEKLYNDAIHESHKREGFFTLEVARLYRKMALTLAAQNKCGTAYQLLATAINNAHEFCSS